MLKYLSLFSGIGAFEKALNNLNVQYETVNYCEIDKHASKSYSAIHNIPESKNLWDITKINVSELPKDIDLITYGFPWQDISICGKQKGMFNDDGSLTRSGLFFKALDIIETVKPKIAIAENVKALTSKKFTNEFKIVLNSLEKAGYNNYWKILNATEYGIPQDRDRVFIVSIRKDIDHNIFNFPKTYNLEKRLEDILEQTVDEKYFLTNDLISKIVKWKAQQKPFKRVLGKKSISPTLTARGAGEFHSGMILYSDTLENTTNLHDDYLQNSEKIKNIRIRRLTPKECYRLMGFADEDFEKAKSVNTSDTQLYKQAGNSIVVNVLEELFCKLLDTENNLLV